MATDEFEIKQMYDGSIGLRGNVLNKASRAAHTVFTWCTMVFILIEMHKLDILIFFEYFDIFQFLQ